MQIEESYISAEQLANLTSQKESVVLATEPILLEGLKLDLIVYGPYRSLSSYIQACVIFLHTHNSSPQAKLAESCRNETQ